MTSARATCVFSKKRPKLATLTVAPLADETASGAITGQPPKFPLAERLYFLNAVRYVARVVPLYRHRGRKRDAGAGRI